MKPAEALKDAQQYKSRLQAELKRIQEYYEHHRQAPKEITQPLRKQRAEIAKEINRVSEYERQVKPEAEKQEATEARLREVRQMGREAYAAKFFELYGEHI